MSVVNNNKACCSIPPAQAEYTPKGTYETIAGLKTYVTGDKISKRLIIYTYDIFGETPQALQGADLLAAGTGALIWMPVFFGDMHVDHSLFAPPSSEEKSKKIQEIFSGIANPATNLPKIDAVIDEAKSRGLERVGSIGYCWGAKIVMLSTKLDAKAGIHPSLLAKGDAEAITCPTALWPSKSEDMDIMNDFNATMQKKSFAEKCAFKHFPDLEHGWAAARANLKDDKEKKDYEDAHKMIANWFNSVL